MLRIQFFDDSTVSYQKVVSGDRVTQITVASFHCLITYTHKKNGKSSANPSVNTRRLCIEWNKWDAIPYIWSYFLITFRRIDSFASLPMDFSHLFHWPRLLHTERASICKDTVVYLFFPFRSESLSSLSLFFFFSNRSNVQFYVITIFPGSRLWGCFRDFLFLLLSLWCGYMFYVCDGRTWMRRNCSHHTALNECCTLSSRTYSVSIYCKNSFSLSFVNIADVKINVKRTTKI